MRFGVEGRALNGPELRALRTSLHLERRNLTRLVNAMGLLRGRRCQNDDIGGWEAQIGYPKGLLDVLHGLDDAVAAMAAALYAAGGGSQGICTIARPSAPDIAAALPLREFGVIVDEATHAAMMGDEGDVWQRLFDAVVARIAELCARDGGRLVIDRPS